MQLTEAQRAARMNGSTYDCREAWLRAAMEATVKARPEVFATIDLAKVRVTVSWPSGGARSKRIAGQTAHHLLSGDKVNEIIISFRTERAEDAFETLVHEMCHVEAGMEAGDGPAFAEVALALGFTRPMASTPATDAFDAWAAPILAELGPWPHAPLGHATRKKQTTRMIKCTCRECGFVFRTSYRWLRGRSRLVCPAVECFEGLMDWELPL